jgi:hypothetical protein
MDGHRGRAGVSQPDHRRRGNGVELAFGDRQFRAAKAREARQDLSPGGIDMKYHYVWLIWSSAFLVPWLALYSAFRAHKFISPGTRTRYKVFRRVQVLILCLALRFRDFHVTIYRICFAYVSA